MIQINLIFLKEIIGQYNNLREIQITMRNTI
jgi:hypothetical protein